MCISFGKIKSNVYIKVLSITSGWSGIMIGLLIFLLSQTRLSMVVVADGAAILNSQPVMADAMDFSCVG